MKTRVHMVTCFDSTVDDMSRVAAAIKALDGGPPPPPVNLAAVARVCAHLAAGNKIEAIKQARSEWGIGLREAKDLVEGVGP